MIMSATLTILYFVMTILMTAKNNDVDSNTDGNYMLYNVEMPRSG